ncbi:uncharacterized protein LOC125033167 [Penaeus chinensis]|uniref:uncharacterized protein LOC125033167 n=1 Tax=Penaeus chinensis TaxID=139456 RepID=UPI001FB6942C|nr:uncharacterized protein LOC125033167 [Penaeus chinensis]
MQAHKYQREMSRIARGGPNKDGDVATIINHVGSVRKTQRSLRLHNKLIRMSMVVAGGYVLGWLPYAAVCMWATYGEYQHIPIEIRVGASLICKSATAYNPFIYYFMSEGFRADLRWLGRRAGFSTKATASGSTYQPSFRSSTRSSIKKSRDRTRENSLNLMTASGKDSISTCITNGNLETPPTPLSLLNSTDAAEDYSMYVMPNPILISSGLQANYNGLPLSTSDLKHMNRCSTSLQGSRKLISESTLSSDDKIVLSYGSKAKLTKCENIPLRYPCRRSVSFSVSPTGSPTITRSPSEKLSGYEHPWRTSRSRSLYGFREHRKLRKQRDLTICERMGQTDI